MNAIWITASAIFTVVGMFLALLLCYLHGQGWKRVMAYALAIPLLTLLSGALLY